MPPALGQYSKEHNKRCARKIASFVGFGGEQSWQKDFLTETVPDCLESAGGPARYPLSWRCARTRRFRRRQFRESHLPAAGALLLARESAYLRHRVSVTRLNTISRCHTAEPIGLLALCASRGRVEM